MKVSKVLIILSLIFTVVTCYSQINETLFNPVSVNAPFNNGYDQLLGGVRFNNYGVHGNFSVQKDNKVFIVSVQDNSDVLNFDPLGFSDVPVIGSTNHPMTYLEMGGGYNFELASFYVTTLAGFGTQFKDKSNRVFVQLDWYNEGNIIAAGVSVRGNYVRVNDESYLVLEPMLQLKIPIWKFRIVHQFGYAFGVDKTPIIALGIEFKADFSKGGSN